MSTPLQMSTVFEASAETIADGGVMSVRGSTRAIAVLLVLLATAFTVGWSVTDVAGSENTAPPPMVFVASACAFVLAVWAGVRPRMSCGLGPLYAIAQGLALGSISHRYEAVSSGVVTQAVVGTIVTLVTTTLLYRWGALRVTSRWRNRVVGAAAGLVGFWVIAASLRIAGVHSPSLESPGLAVLVSVVSVAVAAFFLALDFETINDGVRNRAPRELDWFVALGVVITLVWIYIEMLALMGDDE